MTEPIISIVIPCYNQGQYIDDAIKSVEEYKNHDYEIIIINDGSTDDFTNKRLKELKDYGYNVIFQENQGPSRTRNNGIRLAKGKYILPLDADNMIKPEYIIKAIDILDADPAISIVYSDMQFFGNLNNIHKSGEFDLANMIKINSIDTCAIYRKYIWKEIGGYDETLVGFEDWDFWLSAAEKGFRFYYIPEPLFRYRVLEDSLNRSIVKNPGLKDSLFEYIHKKHVSLILKENERLHKENQGLLDELYRAKHPFKTLGRYIKRMIIN